MRFLLKFVTHKCSQQLPINYQYPLSAAIYKIIKMADEAYANFLHEEGYRYGGKAFKFFTFSDLRTPFYIDGDRLVMSTVTAELTICFFMPDAAENFIKGLFMNQQLVIADSKSKVTFTVQQVVAEIKLEIKNGMVLLQPMSPLVTGRKNERGNYDYVSPHEADFASLVVNNLAEKYAAAHDINEEALQQIKKDISLQTVFFKQPPRHRLLTIKAGTAAETKVRGYDKFKMRLQAPAAVIALALDAGLGMHNAIGMGCVAAIAN